VGVTRWVKAVPWPPRDPLAVCDVLDITSSPFKSAEESLECGEAGTLASHPDDPVPVPAWEQAGCMCQADVPTRTSQTAIGSGC